MNYRPDPRTLPRPPARSSRPARTDRRQCVATEVMAGFLWMSLDLPEDATLGEIERLAGDLAQLGAGGNETVIGAHLEHVQRHQFCRPVDHTRLLVIAKRAVALLTDT